MDVQDHLQIELPDQQGPWSEFREKERAQAVYPLRIRQMWKMYGKSDGNKCGDCAHMIRKSFAKVYRKCGKAKQTNGTGTDWLASWQACGLFNLEAK